MNIVYELTGFQRDLLHVVLSLDSPNGQEIKAKLEATQDRDIPHGRLYANLDDLVGMGLVEKGRIDGRTNRYDLTEEGEEAVEEHHRWIQSHLGR